MISSGLSNLKQKWMPNRLDVKEGRSTLSPGTSGVSTQGSPTPRSRSPSQRNQSGITPRKNIDSNIQRAIAACRSESSSVLESRQHMEMVKESLEDGYCDISGRVGDLRHIGTMGDMKVYVSQEVPPDSDILVSKNHSIARFIHVTEALRAIYKLPAKSLHIFFDLQGDAIAFNRNSSIFLNLRFFEAWHDAEVSSGSLTNAYISWFFTLAHEIAHNLVQPHNAEHEFYFSSLCEGHMEGLIEVLQTTNHGAP